MKPVEITALVPVAAPHDDLAGLYSEFSAAFERLGRPYEFIFVVDGGREGAFAELKALKGTGGPLKVLRLGSALGESAALSVGFAHARGDYIFTLSPYLEVDPESVARLWERLREGADLVVGRRHPRVDSRINRLHSYLFHWVVWKTTSVRIHDLGCRFKAMRRPVLEEISLYGGLHRFIPILAHRRGFRIAEVEVPHRARAKGVRLFGPGQYTQRFLDILTIFFVTKFTMRPLRFFGGIAAAVGGAGALITAYLGLYRLLGFGGIANRPLLLLGVLLMALGVQTLSIGLIGEMIIYIHAKELKEYRIAEILE